MAVERDRAADHRRIAAVLTLPETVTEHCRRRRAAATIVCCRERAPDERRHAEAVEEVAAHPQSLRRPRLAAGRQIEADAAPREDAREHLLPIANLLPQQIGEARAPPGELAGAAADRLRDPDLDQLVGARDRQRADADRVEQLEDRGVGADAERE